MKLKLFILTALFFLFCGFIFINSLPQSTAIDKKYISIAIANSETNPLDRVINENRNSIIDNRYFQVALRQKTKVFNINDIYIHQCEVTQNEFNLYVNQPTNDEVTSLTFNHRISGQLNAPVTGINFFQAQQYCQALGGRLPTHLEWSAAATGIMGNLFPWGNHFINDDNPYIDPLLNTSKSCGKITATSTGNHIHDLAGNVSEWVTLESAPIIKGSNGFDKDPVFSALNFVYREIDPEIKSNRVGFRCVFNTPVSDQNLVKLTNGTYRIGVPNDSILAMLASYLTTRDNPPFIHSEETNADVTDFKLSVHEVTVEQYQRFLLDPMVKLNLFSSPNQPEAHSYIPLNWQEQISHPNRPVTGVDWWSAYAFSAWSGGRLPTQAEWTSAFIHSQPFKFALSTPHQTLRAVTSDCSTSANGICGLNDNVSEWTSSVIVTRGGGTEMIYKGGNFKLPISETIDPNYMQSISPYYRADTLGFRVIYP